MPSPLRWSDASHRLPIVASDTNFQHFLSKFDWSSWGYVDFFWGARRDHPRKKVDITDSTGVNFCLYYYPFKPQHPEYIAHTYIARKGGGMCKIEKLRSVMSTVDLEILAKWPKHNHSSGSTDWPHPYAGQMPHTVDPLGRLIPSFSTSYQSLTPGAEVMSTYFTPITHRQRDYRPIFSENFFFSKTFFFFNFYFFEQVSFWNLSGPVFRIDVRGARSKGFSMGRKSGCQWV